MKATDDALDILAEAQNGTPRTTQSPEHNRQMGAPIRPLNSGAPSRAKLANGEMVAGAAAEGHGILTGFTGRGSMPRAQLLATLATAGFPADWAPTVKSAHAHAGRILNALNQLGYVCRADTKRRKARNAKDADEQDFAMMVAHDAKEEGRHYTADHIVNAKTDGLPTWAARWEVALGKGREAKIGSEFGTVIMIATLDQQGKLWLESDNEALTRRVREDFEARVRAEEYSASDVSDWLKSTLVHKFRAARLGGNWYVRRKYAADAERLLATFARRWGENWMLPALPIATTDQLRVGLANGLIAEANAVLAEYRDKLTAAQSRDRDNQSVRSSTAESLHERIEALGLRAIGFGYVLGNAYVLRVREQLASAAAEIAASIDHPSYANGTAFLKGFDIAAADTIARGGADS